MPDKVLVIDDSHDVHTLLKVRLAREPVVLTHAFSGAEGIAKALEVNPDQILLDVEMPGQSGFDVCRQLKGDSATMHIPIIFLTGKTSSEEKIEGLELGATDYITKPFDPAELRARVRASLRTKGLVDLLARKAMIDGLTGLWNRAYLDARLNSELSAARRTGRPLSCIMCDVDRFKFINDTYGHSFGDEVLRAVAQAIAGSCRTEDIVCRYGGEEFAILLPGTSLEDAAQLAERLRVVVEGMALTCRDQTVSVTCSFGVANPGQSVPPSVIELADQALYRAKHSGRNRVERTAA
jgi:diguanylate cyclase (GGDEF)-like protein